MTAQYISMIDDFENHETRSSGELWTEICSSLPDVQDDVLQANDDPQFTDSFQPATLSGVMSTGPLNCTSTSKWEPMEDSDIYIASLENRLKRLKGQSGEVTSRQMLRSLSQAKKECWDRFLNDAQTSELFQSDDMDEGALEHLKRWLIPEKVAISAEELEYLLRPSQNREPADGAAASDQAPNTKDAEDETHTLEEDDTHTPEK
ncbi:coiled-coil domain-containing protein 32 [Aplochiton taeniatus]